MKTKAVQVRPWARESSSTWLDKATPLRARGVDEQHRTAYNGERGTNDGSSVGRVATGRTKAAVRTSAVKPDSEPLVLF
jgi:hypothetical protein